LRLYIVGLDDMTRSMFGAVLIAAALAGNAADAEPSTFTVATAPFNVAVLTDDGRKATAVLRAHLDVEQEEQAAAVCQWMPRIRDAVSRVFSDHTPRLIERRLDLAGIDDRLVDAINAVLTADLITAVRMTDVVHTLAGGGKDAADGSIVACVGGKATASKAAKGTRKTGDVFDAKVRERVRKRTSH